jgi:DNA-binding GntR family transcriptional regulator
MRLVRYCAAALDWNRHVYACTAQGILIADLERSRRWWRMMDKTNSARRRVAARKVALVTPPDDAVSESSSDRVVNAIIRGILSQRFAPGQKLIEADLTASLGVSRGPVREALKRLDSEGVLLLTPHRGAYVSALTRTEALDLLIVLEGLTATMARLAAEAVAQGANTQKMNEADEQLEAFRNLNGDDMTFIDRRRHFYDALIAIGRNTQLATVMPTMRIQLLRLQAEPYLTREDRQSRLDEYSAITHAVLDGDSKLAERAMRQHMRGMQRRIASLPDEAFPNFKA